MYILILDIYINIYMNIYIYIYIYLYIYIYEIAGPRSQISKTKYHQFTFFKIS